MYVLVMNVKLSLLDFYYFKKICKLRRNIECGVCVNCN